MQSVPSHLRFGYEIDALLEACIAKLFIFTDQLLKLEILETVIARNNNANVTAVNSFIG